MIGIESLERIGSLAGSPRGVGGPLAVSLPAVLEEPPVTSESGEGTIGNLKSASTAEGVRGLVTESILGVFGAVETPGCRWKGEPLSGGYEALYNGEVGDPNDRLGIEAVSSQQAAWEHGSIKDHDEPDLGPARTGPRETICRLAERPWPRLGRAMVEPALLVAWLSTEATEPIETMETERV